MLLVNVSSHLIDSMILESERLLAEDLERLEQAIADRLLEEPKAVSYLDLQLHLFISCDPPPSFLLFLPLFLIALC